MHICISKKATLKPSHVHHRAPQALALFMYGMNGAQNTHRTNKRYHTQETEVLDRLKKILHEMWAPSRYTIPVNQGQLVQARLTDAAFTLRDAPAKSPPPPFLGGTSRVGVMSPRPLQDLAAREAPSADQDEVLPVSDDENENQSNKETADGDAEKYPGLRLDGNALETDTRGGATRKDEGNTRGGALALDVVKGLKGSADAAHRAVTPVVESDAVPKSSVDRANDLSKVPLTYRRRRAGSGGLDEESANELTVKDIDSKADEDAKAGRKETGKRVKLGGEGGAVSDDGRGATEANENRRSAKNASGGGDGTDASPIEVTDASCAGAGAGDIAGPPLAFDMQSILGGCRRASRLKRKRNARNASANSFSGKLSGRASADDQDSKAAARAFSRVLHKVRKLRIGAFMTPGSTWWRLSLGRRVDIEKRPETAVVRRSETMYFCL